jgi:arylsulfatase
LRADHLGVYGYPRDTTPVLDALAREGVSFTEARSQAPWTYPSVVSLLTGLYPSSHGATYSEADGEYVTTTVSAALPTLATLLKSHGYATAAFVANPLLKRYSGLQRGFDEYRDDFVGDWRRKGKGQWWQQNMTAADIHRAVLEWLPEDPQQPIFAYIHYIDVHGPFLDPKPFGRSSHNVSPAQAERARLTGKPRALAIDLYDGELRALDDEIGRFLAALEERGILDQSIVIVTGDHGEEFGDHAGHGHGHTLYEELLHVPLIVARTTAVPVTRRVDEKVGHIDVLPTILDLALGERADDLPGRSLRDLIEGGAEGQDARPLLAEMDNRGRPAWNSKPGDPKVAYALFSSSGDKYILGVSRPIDGAELAGAAAPGREQLFDLTTDRKERRPGASAERLERARAELSAVVGEAQKRAARPSTVPIDAETQERLRVLGYLPDGTSE